MIKILIELIKNILFIFTESMHKSIVVKLKQEKERGWIKKLVKNKIIQSLFAKTKHCNK